MALGIATIANAIAALSVTGLTIKDVDEIPAEADPRLSTLIPLHEYMTDFEVELDSFGGGSTAKMTVWYTLGYRLLFKPLGAGREFEYQANMIAMVAAFLDAVLAIETISGCEGIIPISITNMGNVVDPAENWYVGCDIHLRVQEFVN